jgi:hypothetical protein
VSHEGHKAYEARKGLALPAICAGFGVALLCSACNYTLSSTLPASPTTSTPAAPTTTETFVGTLPVGGTKFYSFNIAVYGTVNATLVSMSGPSVPPDVMVNLGIGTLGGTTCNSSSPTSVSVASTAQVTASEQPGVYCVTIADVGNLPAAAVFTVTIDHP